MSNSFILSWLPVRYLPAPQPVKYEQLVIVNWLDLEVDDNAESKMPLLKQIVGHRHREIFYFVRYEMQTRWDFDFARMYTG